MKIHARLASRIAVSIAALLVAGTAAAQPTASSSTAASPAAKQAPRKAKPAKKVAEPAFKMVLEPQAMELIKATSDKLPAAKSMSFTAVDGHEYLSAYYNWKF